MAKPTQRLAARVQRDFPPEQVEVVLEMLQTVPESLPLELLQNPERIQAALVLPAQGNVTTLLELVALARIDWRDALMGAGLGGEDWPEVLERALGEAHLGAHLYPDVARNNQQHEAGATREIWDALKGCESDLLSCAELRDRRFLSYLMVLLDAGESGVALEDLCSNLCEVDIAVSTSVIDHLLRAASLMGMAPAALDCIRIRP